MALTPVDQVDLSFFLGQNAADSMSSIVFTMHLAGWFSVALPKVVLGFTL